MKLKGAWSYVGSSTYEAFTGDRIHLNGLIRTKDADIIMISTWELVKLKNKCLKIMGWNNKRALMLMCEKLQEFK